MAPAKKSQAKQQPPKLPSSFEPLTVFFDKKLRNLEKRKDKLDRYRELQREGKLTDEGQIKAVAKYDEVVISIAFLKELNADFGPLLLEVGQTVEKENSAKEKESVSKVKSAIKSVLNVQDLFEQLGDDSIRSDFRQANANAELLSDNQLNAIDALYEASKPSRTSEQSQFLSPKVFAKSLGKSSDEWYKLIVKSEASACESSLKYSELSDLFDRVGSSPYFDPEAREKYDQEQKASVELNHVQEEETELPTEPMMPVAAEPVINDDINAPAPIENGDDGYLNGERRRTASEVLGSLTSKSVISFVQDDVQPANEDPAVLIARKMPHVNNSTGLNDQYVNNSLHTPLYSSYKAGLFDGQYSNPDNAVPAAFDGYQGKDELFQQPGDVQPLMDANQNINENTKPFAGGNWAEDSRESFENSQLAGNGTDSFVEVRRGVGRDATNVRKFDAPRGAPQQFGNRGGGFRGGYRGDFRGGRGGPRGGFEGGQRGAGGNQYRRDDGRGQVPYSAKPDGFRGAPRGGPRGQSQRYYNTPNTNQPRE